MRFIESLDDDPDLRRLFFHPLRDLLGKGSPPQGPPDKIQAYVRSLTTQSIILDPTSTDSTEFGSLLVMPGVGPVLDFLNNQSTVQQQIERKHADINRTLARTIERGRVHGLIQGTVTLAVCGSSGHRYLEFTDRDVGTCPTCNGAVAKATFLKVEPLLFKAWDNGALLELWLYSILKRAGLDVTPPTLVVCDRAQIAELDLTVKRQGRPPVLVEASVSLNEPSNECKRALGNAMFLSGDTRVIVVSGEPVGPQFKRAFGSRVTILDDASNDNGFPATLIAAVNA